MSVSVMAGVSPETCSRLVTRDSAICRVESSLLALHRCFPYLDAILLFVDSRANIELAVMAHFVSFPTSESTPAVPQPVPHLPFRRISLPTAPNLAAIAYRHSVVSVSADAEEALVLAHQHRRSKRRSLNPGARSRRRTPENDARDAKRGKIVSEFFDTERSYLDGLDLVYNVGVLIDAFAQLIY